MSWTAVPISMIALECSSCRTGLNGELCFSGDEDEEVDNQRTSLEALGVLQVDDANVLLLSTVLGVGKVVEDETLIGPTIGEQSNDSVRLAFADPQFSSTTGDNRGRLEPSSSPRWSLYRVQRRRLLAGLMGVRDWAARSSKAG